MRTKILLTFLVVLFFAACEKDTYQTKPQLKYKEVNTTELNAGQTIRFTIEVTDKEGDIQDSIWIEKVSKNCNLSNFSAKYPMPQFDASKDLKADIEVAYGYDLVSPKCTRRNDTATFKFWIKDKGQNTSDTIESEVIVIRY